MKHAKHSNTSNILTKSFKLNNVAADIIEGLHTAH